jgi:cell division protease FtsH
VSTEEDKRVTAYHEAGHAVAAHLLPEVEPLHKVTIVPRGMALGATMQLPERDKVHLQRKSLLGNIKLLYAGRIAEQMFCGDVTAGAANDIERATEIVRRMVCEWGMSENIGPIKYAESEETLFLGREVTKSRNHSEALSLRIDEEVRRIIEECYAESELLLGEHREAVVRVAEALVAQETLSAEEVAVLVAGRPPEETT